MKVTIIQSTENFVDKCYVNMCKLFVFNCPIQAFKITLVTHLSNQKLFMSKTLTLHFDEKTNYNLILATK